MTRTLKIAGWVLLALLLAALVALMVWEPLAAKRGDAPAAARVYEAEIVRSEFGVPHIYGETDADVAYGVAIAHSQDDFATLQDVAAMTRGRYGAIAGEEGAQIDFMYHLLDARGTAERHYGALPADTRALFEAYAAGLNDYAAANPAEVKLDRLFPLDGEDVATGFALRQPFFFGLANVIGPLVSGEPLNREHGPTIPGERVRVPPEPYAQSISDPSAWDGARDTLRNTPLGPDAAQSGSNAWAIAPEASGGPTILVSNSHQPWRGQVAWYELVVESGEGWHYAGANFPGSPYPFLGHNEHLGWTNTVNTPDMVDVYRLTVDEAGENYRFDGEWRPLESRDVILPVRFGPLVIPVPRTVHRSVHGPVIENEHGWFAVRYGGMDDLGQLDAYYRLNKARDLGEFQRILARMAIPSTNFVYADEAGNIGLFYNAAIPDRPAGFDWRGILPGDRSDALSRGTVGFDAVPKIVNPESGWVFNANNTPFVAAGAGSELDPADFAPELGIELKMTNRARRAAKLMEEAETLDRATIERIKYDTGYERAGYVARMLDEVAALDLPRGSDLARAQGLLARWDFAADNVGRADALALLMIRPFMGSAYQNTPGPMRARSWSAASSICATISAGSTRR